jgi:hypothetical protein
MRALHPGWDPTPWIRSQRALYRGRYKWIESSAGGSELYDLERDPGEQRDVAALRELDASMLRDALEKAVAGLAPCTRASAPVVSEREREMLQMLGYEESPPSTAESAEGTEPADPDSSAAQRSGSR